MFIREQKKPPITFFKLRHMNMSKKDIVVPLEELFVKFRQLLSNQLLLLPKLRTMYQGVCVVNQFPMLEKKQMINGAELIRMTRICDKKQTAVCDLFNFLFIILEYSFLTNDFSEEFTKRITHLHVKKKVGSISLQILF